LGQLNTIRAGGDCWIREQRGSAAASIGTSARPSPATGTRNASTGAGAEARGERRGALEIERERIVERGIELVDHVPHRMGTLLWPLLQHSHHERAEQRRNLPGRNQLRDWLLLSTLDIEVRVVRRITGQQLVRERAQSVHIVRGSWWLAAQLRGTRGER
jgi:hypothetical protein